MSNSEEKLNHEERSTAVKCIEHITLEETADLNRCDIHSTIEMLKLCSEVHLEEPPRKRFRTKMSFQGVSCNMILHDAVEFGDKTAVCTILQRERQVVDVQDNNGDTALHLAARHGNKGIAVMLMLSGANIRLQNCQGLTPLHVALHHRKKSTATVIAKKDPRNVIQDENGDTPLHFAAQNGYTGIVRHLLASSSTRLQNKKGCTPLHIALYNREKSTAMVITKKDNGNIMQDENGNTPLHVAAQNGYPEIVKNLLAARTDDRLQNKEGCTALHVALSHEREDIANIIIDTTPVNDVQNEDGETPFHYAVRKGYTIIIKKLLAAGVNAHVQDRYGYTPLHFALYHKNEGVANVIIDTASVNEIENIGGNTPLHLAVANGYVKIARKLVAFGINAHLQNNGVKLLQLALRLNKKDIANVMLATYALRDISIDWKSLGVKLSDMQYCMELFSVCKTELQLMKQTKLNRTSISYYDVARAHVHKLAVYLKNDDIRDVLLQDNKELEFKNYAGLIVCKVLKAETRRILSDQCLACFSALAGELPLLPVTSTDIILEFLNELEMKNFAEAFNFET